MIYTFPACSNYNPQNLKKKKKIHHKMKKKKRVHKRCKKKDFSKAGIGAFLIIALFHVALTDSFL